MSHYPSILNWSEYSYSALMINPPVREYDNIYLYIPEKKAYTEDNVVIYNIVVNSIPNELSEDKVRRYFSKFGKLLDVKFEEDKSRSRCATSKVGFVSFAEPESAFSVLQRKNHRLQGLRIGVIAGDSWNQPNADKVCDPTKNEDDAASTSKESSKDVTAKNNGMHLLSLNDDCLETIFGCLELKEQVRFARVCERLQDIFKMHCKRKYKNLALSSIRGMTLWETRDFLRFAGENMASITGTLPYTNGERIVEFIYTFCGKLNRIQVDNSRLENVCLEKLLHSCPQLQELSLRSCSLNDSSIQTMAHLKRLQILDLEENYEITGKFISKFVQLKVLNLHRCYDIKTSHLVDICKSLRKLRSLDIRLCHCLSPTPVDVIVDHCKELEILKMSCLDFPYERVALLPRLKRLGLICYYGVLQKRLLAELVVHKADQLEVLKIDSTNALSAEHIALISELRQMKSLFVAYNALVNDDALNKFCKLQQLEDLTIKGCRNITNQGLLKLVKSCQQLRRLNIEFCEQITIKFLLETITFLKASGKRKHPLVVKTYGTAMDYDDAIKFEEYIKAKEQSLIRVIFNDLWLRFSLEEGGDICDLRDGKQRCDEDDNQSEDD